MGRGGQTVISAEFSGMPPRRKKGESAMLARLGENIRAARKAHGFTQERLAELIDLHPRAVQKIEAGELNPKSTTLIRIQDTIRCTWDCLVHGRRGGRADKFGAPAENRTRISRLGNDGSIR
jgi:transcriptional regulator with XRE-family HTH domain